MEHALCVQQMGDGMNCSVAKCELWGLAGQEFDLPEAKGRVNET